MHTKHALVMVPTYPRETYLAIVDPDAKNVFSEPPFHGKGFDTAESMRVGATHKAFSTWMQGVGVVSCKLADYVCKIRHRS